MRIRHATAGAERSEASAPSGREHSVVAPGTARFAYATFENGGGERFNDGASLVGVGGGTPGTPVLFVDHVSVTKSRGTGILFGMQPSSAFITNSAFKDIAGHAVTEGWKGGLVSFRPTNTFEGVTGCIQTMPSHPTECPEPRPICDGQE